MELIVAVYADWGIGCSGTQPIALSADRKFFREITKGCMVIAFAGGVTEDAEECNEAGIDAFFPIVRGVIDLDTAMEKGHALHNMEAALS